LVFLYIHLLCNSSTSSPTVACSSNGQGDRLSGVEMSGNFTAVSNCLESGQPDLKVLLWTCCRMSMFVDVLIRHAATLVDGGGSCLPCALYCAPRPLFVSYCQEDDAVCTLSLLLLSTLVRHAKYSFKIVRLCRICQHCSVQ